MINMKKEKNESVAQAPKDNRRLRHGTYSIAMTAIVLVAVLIINLIVGQIPSQYTQIDLSGQQLSVLTDTTKEMAEGLTEDVTIYYLVQDSSKDSYVDRLLDRYDDLSSHITVVEKDPVLNPQFASQYTDESLSENSVIVTCGDKSRVISYDEMYEYSFDYTYYTYTTTGFDAEGQITSAIAALTSESLPKMYTLTGHGEIELTDTLVETITKDNIETDELNLLTADSVPEDADCVLIASPLTDLSSSEAQKLINYLRLGGSAIIITDYTTEEMPNLTAVLDYYGVELVDGIILEGDSNYYYWQYPTYLIPEIESTEVSSDLAGGYGDVLLVEAQGIATAEDIRDGVSVEPVLSTSQSAYSKTDVTSETYQKENGDIDGPFDIGVLITEEVELTDALREEASVVEEDAQLGTWLDALMEEETEEDTEENTEDGTEYGIVEETEDDTEEDIAKADTAQTRLAVFSSSVLINDSANSMTSGGNYRLFANTLSWACDEESSVSVPSKSLEYEYLTMTSASANFWGIVSIVLIPGALLIAGLVIWLRRRHR